MSSKTEILSDNISCIRAIELGKCYKIYEDPKARLKQALFGGRRKYYQDFWALRNVDFEIRQGESVGIVGRNGSGKSTLLQMICGTLTPTEGSVSTSGTVAALLELGSGFNPEFTGIENIYLNASLLGLSKQKTESRIEDIKAFADIGDFINQPVKTYSSGMLVRLGFAVMAHVEPAILIVDEALSVGDAVFGQRCMRFIRKFTEKGTLLFVSHDLNSVSSLCERALWIESGNLRIDGTNATVITAYTKYCLQSSAEESIELKVDSESRMGVHADNERTNMPNDKKKQPFIKGAQQAELANKRVAKRLKTHNIPAFVEENWNTDHDYGNMHAQILEAYLNNNMNEKTSAPVCGESVLVSIVAQCNQDVDNFMAGFILRDHCGLTILGENNIRHGQVNMKAGEIIRIGFEFKMPFLKSGTYSLSVGISENDPDIVTVMHYKPDAIIIQPILGNREVHGILALPKVTISTKINP
jgi:lipopolysaccharide transport system ATP-binding protein